MLEKQSTIFKNKKKTTQDKNNKYGIKCHNKFQAFWKSQKWGNLQSGLYEEYGLYSGIFYFNKFIIPITP